MFLFKGRQCKDSQRTLIIDGVTIHCSESVSDLGHNVSTNDKDSIAKSSKANFWRSAPLWSLNSEATEDICIAWRKALRMLWGLYPMTHCDILIGLSNQKPLDVQLKYRFICFLNQCLDYDNATVRNVALIALNNPMP